PRAVERGEQVYRRGHPATQARAEITGPPRQAAAHASACRGGRGAQQPLGRLVIAEPGRA
ncbi:MAG TPA: hypothetical protein VIV12_08810, partial [Streptosporangiaceae bacterium]